MEAGSGTSPQPHLLCNPKRQHCSFFYPPPPVVSHATVHTHLERTGHVATPAWHHPSTVWTETLTSPAEQMQPFIFRCWHSAQKGQRKRSNQPPPLLKMSGSCQSSAHAHDLLNRQSGLRSLWRHLKLFLQQEAL